MINLTESGYGDYNAVWVNEGKQMLWFSDRNGLRSYANSGSRQMDVYTMFFIQEEWDKFGLWPMVMKNNEVVELGQIEIARFVSGYLLGGDRYRW